ncbi:MAG: hypothetical protein EHM89_16825 [Acidobacteria bacterium]|nr:MAG: hypothetical protein EHM89_16825 [Acidobacteriota bacterium]
MAAAQIPGFDSTPAAEADWFTAILGGAILPGIVTVEKLKVGIDCDTKKAKGSDQPTSSDNGLDPAKFAIRVWMNSAHYAEWQQVLPHFNPRRPGRDRAPCEFLHPMTYELGISNVRVISIESEQPSGRHGFVRVINVEEWFDKSKAVPKKSQSKIRPQDAFDYKHVSEAIAVGGGNAGTVGLWGAGVRQNQLSTGEEVDPNTFQPLDPGSEESIENTMFEEPVKTIREYLGIPPRGFR